MTPSVTAELVAGSFARLRPPRVRTFRQFAEEEIVLATGPRAGMMFRCEFMPFNGLLLDVMSGARYRRFFASGSVQTSKTLLLFVVPIMYHLFELQEPVIVGVPKMDIAQGIYEERIRPSIQASRYRDLLPTSGAGSRGGKFIAATMRNGATLRFMAGGAGDEQRSSFTSRVIVLTEIDKMDVAGKASREADPIVQLEARSRAYGAHARIYGECTMSIEGGRIHQEIVRFGTDTRIHVPCPGCGEFVPFEREHFAGWQGAEDVMEARARAGYACPECARLWSEAERLDALKRPMLVSKGQSVSKDGQVEGEPPRTETFGVRWNAMHSALTTMADISETEWRADQSGNPSDMKAVYQFTWALPWTEDLVDLSAVSRDIILRKITPWPRGIAPPGTRKVTVGIDLGKYLCWWAAWAWSDRAVGHCIDYGHMDVPQGREKGDLSILSTLREFRDNVLVHGWQSDGQSIRPNLVLVDSGYEKGVAYRFCVESGVGYLPSKGHGTARNQDAWRMPRKSKGRQIGNEWMIQRQPQGVMLVSIHADHWKAQIHQGFGAASGEPGSLSIYQAQPIEHSAFARHIVAEKQREEFVPGRGTRVYWDQTDSRNHWLDCSTEARVAADICGIKPDRAKRTTDGVRRPAVATEQPAGRKIRAHY